MEPITATITSVAGRVERLPAAVINRVVGLAMALPAWSVLGLAAWITPSPTGVGTHTQLGMGGCMMLMVTGYPCPMCGMTTTFALMAHLRPVDAFLNQPFGPVLFMVAVVFAVVGAVDLVSGLGWWRKLLAVVDRLEQRLALALLVGLFAGWIYKVLLMHPEFWQHAA